ncbi:PilN domain-containing protein [Ensifer adhaerens]|jgi:general secretion pathway protein L|uniref:PilN domain-containing protein n=1 Tax=Rhizobium sp. 11_C7_N12_5 TaxID=3240770 RepID=UPI0013AEC527|nr:hypothetical protein [Ensifer adhaerens]
MTFSTKNTARPNNVSGQSLTDGTHRIVQRVGEWWLGEARKLLAGRWAQWLLGGGERWLLIGTSETGDDIELRIVTRLGQVVHSNRTPQTDHTIEPAKAALAGAGFDIDKMPIGIVMPDGAVFERSIEIPREAIANLRIITAQEMARRTPFRPEQIYMRMILSAHPGDRTKRLVRQRIIRRDLAAERCRQLGLDLDKVQFVTTPDAVSGDAVIHLAEARSQQGYGWRRLMVLLVILGFGFAAIDAGIVWWRQQAALDEIESELPRARAKALAVRKMLDEIASTQAAVQTMFDRRSAPSALEVWEEASRILPDSSWLTEFSVRDGHVSMAGYSDNAAALIPLIGRSTRLADVTLSSPIVAQGGTQLERFAISARISGDFKKAGSVK